MKTAIALGTFDGVHKGHREVLNIPSGFKREAVIFIEPPKSAFLDKKELLTPIEEKINILKSLGIEDIHILDFAKVKDISAEQFLEFLKEKFAPTLISCGFNYRFGKGGLGDKETLKRFCDKNGIELRLCDAVKDGEEIISSTLIRGLLKAGQVEKANRLLCNNFSFTSTVIEGDKRGRVIGFPTVNQKYPEKLVKPKFGVYKSKVYINGEQYEGITNIGVRPTYPADYIISETYIENFSDDVYGQDVKISLIRFLREEKKFSSLEELKNQINEDIKK